MSVVKDYQPARDLVEFSFYAEPVEGQEGVFDLKVELRVDEAEVDDSPDSKSKFSVALKRVIIKLEMSGTKIKPGSKLGEPIVPNSMITKRSATTEIEKKISGSIGAKADAKISTAANASANIEAGLSGNRKAIYKEEVTIETTEFRVRAEGNDQWRVAEMDNRPLSGKILNDETLCKIESSKIANAALVCGTIMAKQKDLSFSFPTEGIFARFNHTDKKLMSIFLSKKLAVGEYAGDIKLAEFEIEIDRAE